MPSYQSSANILDDIKRYSSAEVLYLLQGCVPYRFIPYRIEIVTAGRCDMRNKESLTADVRYVVVNG